MHLSLHIFLWLCITLTVSTINIVWFKAMLRSAYIHAHSLGHDEASAYLSRILYKMGDTPAQLQRRLYRSTRPRPQGLLAKTTQFFR